jgi:hypothetical protein
MPAFYSWPHRSSNRFRGRVIPVYNKRKNGRFGWIGSKWESFGGAKIRISSRSSRSLPGNNVPLDHGLVDRVKIEAVLDIQPVLRRGAKVAAEARGSVRRDTSLPIHDQADAVRRHPDRLGQTFDADLLVFHVFEQILPGWIGGSFLPPLVVVRDFDVGRSLRFPMETDSILVVDTNAELALAAAAQRFRPIAAKRPKVLRRSRGVQPDQARSSLPSIFTSSTTRRPPITFLARSSLND